MIRCSCSHDFEPSLEAFHAAQVITGIQYCLLYTCPHCQSTRSILMWEAVEVGIHFGEIEDEDDGLMMAAE